MRDWRSLVRAAEAKKAEVASETTLRISKPPSRLLLVMTLDSTGRLINQRLVLMTDRPSEHYHIRPTKDCHDIHQFRNTQTDSQYDKSIMRLQRRQSGDGCFQVIGFLF